MNYRVAPGIAPVAIGPQLPQRHGVAYPGGCMPRFLVSAMALCAVSAFFPASKAHAVTLAKLNGAAPQLQLCAKASCPVVAGAPAASAGMIPVFEFSGPFARVSPYMTREAAAARYPSVDSSRLPEKPALWIARALISTGDAAADLAAAQKPEEPSGEAAARPRLVKPPVPQPSPRKRIAAAGPAAEPERPAPAASSMLPQLPAASAQLVASAPSLSPSPVKPEPEPATQPEAPPAEEAAAAPAVLTPELMDKRLKALPAKADAGHTIGQVVALRRQGLAFLTDGACTTITEGGKTTTPGFLYIICDGDGAWRLFPE